MNLYSMERRKRKTTINNTLMVRQIPHRSYMVYRCEDGSWFTRSGTAFVTGMITLTPEVSSLPPVSPGPRAERMGPIWTGDSNGEAARHSRYLLDVATYKTQCKRNLPWESQYILPVDFMGHLHYFEFINKPYIDFRIQLHVVVLYSDFTHFFFIYKCPTCYEF